MISRRFFLTAAAASALVKPTNPYDKWWEDELVPVPQGYYRPEEVQHYVQIFRKSLVITDTSRLFRDTYHLWWPL